MDSHAGSQGGHAAAALGAPISADLLQSWVRTAVVALGDARAEIDALNVFPVPDGDTGTNMFLTIEAAERSMAEAAAELSDTADEAEALARLSTALIRGAMLGARGNSGVILSQILRGMVAVDPHDDATTLKPAAEVIRIGLQRASDLAYASVGDPKEGTILTVVRRAAQGVAELRGSLAEVVVAAADAAEQALAATTEQLPQLRAAGVVDSGGRGFVVILAALVEVVTGRRRPPPPATAPAVEVAADQESSYSGPAYEVMYLLDAPDDAIADLKRRLKELGDSLVVVGGDGLWNVHVHVDDAGAAIETALAIGRPHRIAVTYLVTTDGHRGIPAGRSLVAVAHGPGIVQLLSDEGVIPVIAQPRLAPATGEILQAVMTTGAGEVVILPSDKETRSAAEAAAVEARERGLRVAVVPTRSIAQSLAAIAVHDADLPFDDDVVTMSRASGATHYGAITVSSRAAVTSAGRCAPGDILGVIDGDILVIGADRAAVAVATLERMLSAGAELVTVITGADAEPTLVSAITAEFVSSHPSVDFTVVDGGQQLWPLIFGVE